jgi:hypothetical protein
MMDQLYRNKLDWFVQVSRGNILNAEVQHSLGHGADGHPAAAERMTGGEGQGQTVQRPNRAM